MTLDCFQCLFTRRKLFLINGRKAPSQTPCDGVRINHVDTEVTLPPLRFNPPSMKSC